ncbi:hypothetical protein HanIR_Chr08g0359431 [Helianthus annuus]|nr:hypothetical protein HanIR_Chr08g0359431 [Helianthus annuus]
MYVRLQHRLPLHLLLTSLPIFEITENFLQLVAVFAQYLPSRSSQDNPTKI